MERGNPYLKVVDRYVGIPLVWLLGKLRPHRQHRPAVIRRIAIIKGAAIGDTVLLSAIVQDIRANLPGVELVFFCGKTCFETAKLIPGISQVVLMPTTQPFQTIRMLRQAGRFDLVIDAGPWTRLEAIFSYFTKGDYRIGFRSIGQYRHYAFDQPVEHSDKQHELENNRNLIRPFVPHPVHMPTLTLPTVDLEAVQNRVGLTPSYWILHAWSGGFKGHLKEWVGERWADVATWLTTQGYQVAFSGTKADRPPTDELVQLCRQRGAEVVNLAGETSLHEMMAIVKAAEGVVSVNTGIMHIAAALNVPMVALNGPVPSHRWGALSAKAVNIDARQPHCGYIHLGFEYPHVPPDCMGSISVFDVQAAIEKVRFSATRSSINKI